MYHNTIARHLLFQVVYTRMSTMLCFADERRILLKFFSAAMLIRVLHIIRFYRDNLIIII